MVRRKSTDKAEAELSVKKKIAEAVKTVKQKAEVKKEEKIPLYVTKRGRVTHPQLHIQINTGRPTPCPRDSWLDSQINAGIVVEC